MLVEHAEMEMEHSEMGAVPTGNSTIVMSPGAKIGCGVVK